MSVHRTRVSRELTFRLRRETINKKHAELEHGKCHGKSTDRAKGVT